MKHYLKVRYRDLNGTRFTKLIEVQENKKFDSLFLIGYEVNQEGERIWKQGKFDERLLVIDRVLIFDITGMMINRKYGTLEQI